ncbi:hypothetical protein F5888DRAFT_1804260 [Russula emetica]|nr:hypothetical protein F5888DRAFT_1804260 [Russula emetica]
MTNFNDPAVQQKDFGAYAFALGTGLWTLDRVMKPFSTVALQTFWHMINGIYVWEYVTTLGFELDVIRGRRSYRWTIWIYSLARTALLISITLNLVDLNVTTPVDCQALITLQVAISYVSLLSASLLVTIRIIAIWNKNKFAVGIAVITWVTNVSVVIQGVARLRATWEPTVQTCIILNSDELKPTLVITVIADTISLVTMLVGVFRLLAENSAAFGLGRLLWKQGIIWLLIATAAGIPPTASSTSFPVYLLSHRYMNDPGIHFFESEPYVTLFPLVSMKDIKLNAILRISSIKPPPLGDHKYNRCDTDLSLSGRLYLEVLKSVLLHSSIPFFSPLIIVGGSFCSSMDAGFSKSDTRFSKMKWNNPAPISRNRIEVAVDTKVDTAYEQYPTSQTTLSVETQQGDKLHELSVGSDLPVECAIEIGIAI